MTTANKLLVDWEDIDVEPLSPPHPHYVLDATLGFKCAPLTAPQRLNVITSTMQGDAVMLTVRYSVRDWRGVRTMNGDPVDFSQKALDRLFEDARTINLLSDLAQRIGHRSVLTEEERKNS